MFHDASRVALLGRAFVASCFDGNAFGDGWDYTGDQSVRCTTAVAQEPMLVFRVACAWLVALFDGLKP